MPDYITLAYEGNFVGRMGENEVFTWNGEVWYAHYRKNLISRNTWRDTKLAA